MARKLDDVLSDCLDMLAAGQGIESCLERFPEHREELRPLLETASVAMTAATSATYSQEAKAHGLSRLTAAVVERGVPSSRWSRWFGWQARVPRLVYAGALAVFVTTGTVVGTGAAASDSVPGEPLYWVKTQRENISLMLPQSDTSKAETHARLATERFHEMSRLSDMGRFDEAEKVVTRIWIHLGASAGFIKVQTVSNPIEMPIKTVRFVYPRETVRLKSSLERDMDLFRSRFAELTANMVPEHRHKFEVLMRRSEFGYYTLISALEGSPVSMPRPSWRVETASFRDE